MRWPQAIRLNLQDHWVNEARGASGDQLPANVVPRWSFFARQARRSRNAYYLLEALALMLAASVPASAALGAGIGVAAVLGAGVVVANGLRQIGRFHEEWISSAQARYAIEREIVLFTWGKQPYHGADARANLAAEAEKIASAEGERFIVRREKAAKSEASPHQV